MARALGITDSVTSCDCCGKANLARTVCMELDNGDIVHYGTTCAARNTGKTSKEINSEVRAAYAANVKAARAEFYACPAYLAERAQFAARDRLAVPLFGLKAAEFVREAGDAADAACKEIAARHGVQYWEVRA